MNTEPRTLIEAIADYCESPARVLGLCLAVLILMLITGCASFEPPPYWIANGKPRAYAGTIYVALPDDLWGAAYADGTVAVSTKAPPLLWDCIEQHEKTHLRGYTHQPEQIGGVWCGLTQFQRMP